LVVVAAAAAVVVVVLRLRERRLEVQPQRGWLERELLPLAD
jgi:hypothetical protein